MKILLVSSSVLPVPCPGYGGLEKIVYDLAVELDALGHKVSVAAPSFSRLPESIELIDCGKPGRINESHIHAMISKRVNDLEFDIVHDHSWTKMLYLDKQKNDKIKLISTLHGMNPYGTPPPVSRPNMVCLSQDHAMRTSGALGIVCKSVYNGIDLSFYTCRESRPAQPGPSDYLLWLGRFMPGKGAHIAAEVAKAVNIPLYMVGDDTMVESKEYVNRMRDLAMDSSGLIHYWGPQPRERCAEFFRNAWAFLQCGLEPWIEPFGLVTIEALASGTPVVALRNGATTEIIENFNAKNLDDVGILCNSIEMMIKAVKSQILADIRPDSCRIAANFYSRRNMAKGYLFLYEEILNQKEW